MKETWSYDKEKRVDKKGNRWYFVRHDVIDNCPYEERPVEWYFRNDNRTVFGVFRVDRQKEIPYRDYETMIRSIMNKTEFRETLVDPETQAIWQKNWK
jgi:hypothetical protein